MGLYYKSTRNSNLKVTASEAILKGLAPDGGLFVPSELPKLDVTMSDLKGKTYQEIAYLVMKQFLTDFTEEELKNCIDKAYDSKFDTEEIAPLVKVDDTYYMELFHGATIAFKDMALSIRTCRLCGCGRNEDHRILSKEWCQQGTGTPDGDTERRECKRSSDPWQFR